MTFPRLHLNGTSAQSLQEAIADATSALSHAERRLHETAPHGRDYYVISPSAFSAAQSEHLSRLARLQAVREELTAVWNDLDTQDTTRRRPMMNPRTVWARFVAAGRARGLSEALIEAAWYAAKSINPADPVSVLYGGPQP